jgi:hypothetical protein
MPYPIDPDKRHSEGERIADLLVSLTSTLEENFSSPPSIPGHDRVTLVDTMIDATAATREATQQQEHSTAHLIAAIERATEKIVQAIDRASGTGTDVGS